MDSTFDWPWPPTQSTSTLPEPPTWPIGDASPRSDSLSSASRSQLSTSPSPAPSHASTAPSSAAGKKRMSCATCRNAKMKCVWVGDAEECVGCVKRGLSCAGSAPRANNRKLKQADELVELLPQYNSAVVPTHRQTYSINSHYSAIHARPSPPPFSPYHTAAGRPRNLNQSSSEANLNAWSRASILRADLLDLYRNMWPLQLMGLPVNAFEELFDGKGDEVTKVFISICTAIGARSSSHSEIVQQVGPSLATVDDDPAGQFTSGGFSEWGLRRHGACFALGTKAVNSASALIESQPSFKTLKLALAAATLASTLQADRHANRPFTVLAIQTWRRLVVSPETTPAEMDMLLHRIGPVLLMRDRGYSFSTAEKTEFTSTEASIIVNANPPDPEEYMFGIPDCANMPGLVLFDENTMLISYFKHHLLNMHSFAEALVGGLHDPATIARLREIQRWMDRTQAPLYARLAEIEALPPERVFMVHEWGGSWRPSEPKLHALILVSEITAGFERINEWVYSRLTHEPWPAPTLEQSVFKIEVRERCRAGLKGLARSCRHWLAAPRKHANFANLLQDTTTIPGWVELALGRFGDADGPLAKADELTVEEVELIVRGLRIGSFSQGSLVIALREMERGLEELRREEREKRREEEGGEKDVLDLDLDDFLAGLDYASAPVV